MASHIVRRERTIVKAVLLLSILVLVILGGTFLFARFLSSTPSTSQPIARGWQRTPEIRIVMDSTADWARIMFNDLEGTDANGIRVVEFGSSGWLLGNDSGDRIDAGHGLTFVDIIYNATVVKTGDIVGFFKGNNDFEHTKMYTDIVLEVNTNLRQVSFYVMLAGAGTTNIQLTNKQSGAIIWQTTETGNGFTQYARRWVSPEIFFAKERIDEWLIFSLVAGAIGTIAVVNMIGRRNTAITIEDQEDGL